MGGALSAPGLIQVFFKRLFQMPAIAEIRFSGCVFSEIGCRGVFGKPINRKCEACLFLENIVCMAEKMAY